jgi:fumarylpyruvate hydrolase
MSNYVIEIGPQSSLPVAGSGQRFPVGRIYCVGRNYADHAREMGHDPDREAPFFFMKPANSIVQNNASLSYPVGTKDVHHEIELVVAIGKGGKNIAVDKALSHVWGYGVGLDMTRRDIQGEAKKQGRPWEMGKSFDESAPVTALRPASEIGHPAKGAITLKVNGQVRQSGDLAMQIWNVPEQISYLSHLITLQPGDLIFTGTPAGVGPIKPGDKLEGHVDGVGDLVISYKG